MDQSDREERAALLALLRASPKSVSWHQIASEVAFHGSARALSDQPSDEALFSDPHVQASVEQAHRDLDAWEARGLRMVTVLDAAYPQRLLDIRETPPFLFYEGDLRAEDAGMSVVGSRNASSRGLEFADAAARLLVGEGLSVIAGLAAGVDATAHRAALDAGGRTVAFIGTGITKSYPAANRDLQAEIARRGLVVSQFLPDAPPTKQTFPMRNASMSGYGLATIVVEAGENSGTRIQARLAMEHGRAVILTSPVVASTTWGAALAARPGVHVVDGLDDLARAVDSVRGERDEIRAALRELALAEA